MGYFYRATTGGDNNATVPATPATMSDSTEKFTITLTNAEADPAAVEISQSSAFLRVFDPDDGTITEPSYVVEPGGSRDVIFYRNDTESDELPMSVSYTGSQGLIRSDAITVSLPDFGSCLRTIATPVIEFDGSLNNTGSANDGSAGNPSTWSQNSGTLNSGYSKGFDGSFDSARVQRTAVYITGDNANFGRFAGQNRSWVWVFEGIGDAGTWPVRYNLAANAALAGDSAFSATSSGYLDRYNTLVRLNYSGVSRYDLDADWDHTDGGASENFNDIVGSQNALCILAICFDGTAQQSTVRWNWSGSARRGHSFRGPYAVTVHTSSTSASFSAGGVYNNTNSANNTRWFYSGIINHTLTASEFQKLSDLIRVY